MDNDRIAYNFAVGSQGFEGSFEDFKNLPEEERNEYEEGSNGAGNTTPRSDAWHTGYEHASRGGYIIDNPYARELWTHDQWYLGWREYIITNTLGNGEPINKPDEYEGWYDCVNDRYDPTGEVPYRDEADFLDMCKQNWGEIECPDLTHDIDGKIYAVDIDGKRELVLVKRVKKELD